MYHEHNTFIDMEKKYIKVPRLSKSESIGKSIIQHLTPNYICGKTRLEKVDDIDIIVLIDILTKDEILITDDSNFTSSEHDKILLSENKIDLKNLQKEYKNWLKHPYQNQSSGFDTFRIHESWEKFRLTEENIANEQNGLRDSQLGAIYSILSHWTKSNEKGIIVLPTGTGKTEVMLSVLVKEQIDKLLVIVPSDALREQIGNKFLSLGLLMQDDFKMLPKNSQTPVVGLLKHIPTDEKEINLIVEKSNVIVTTINSINAIPLKLKKAFFSHLSHLFVDEAHHHEAKTWKETISLFDDKPTLLFTATPYREDKKHIEGEILYQYPLKLAQKNNYYKKINFKPFYEWDKAKQDERLAEAGVKQLREDIKNGCDHILMARCYPNKEANRIFKIYQKYPEYNPVIIHSGFDEKEKRKLREKILSKGDDKPRIIVCVDMLGEGFDLPELKIGVFHYIRKSLTPTLQLVGRFTRTKLNTKLGNATFIANLADQNVKQEIDALYKHDSDWNHLISDLSDTKSDNQKKFWDFITSHKEFPDNIPLQLLTPNMSTVLFKTEKASINLENFENGLEHLGPFDEIKFDLNKKANSLVIVLGRKTNINWGKIGDIYNISWDLFVLFWDEKHKVLSLNSSDTSSKYESFAKAIVEDAVLLKGEKLFRCFHNMNLIKLNRAGLRDINGKLATYRNTMGSDVEPTINAMTQGGSQKVDIFGKGYEDGNLVTIGCSEKGRIWAWRDANLLELKEWCINVTSKVLNPSIVPNDIFLKYTCKTKVIVDRPDSQPILIDWDDDIYNYQTKSNIKVYIDGVEYFFYELELELFKPSLKGDIIFQLVTDDYKVQYKLIIDENGYSIKSLSTKKVIIQKGTKEFDLREYLELHPPLVRFIDGSELSSGNQIVELNFQSHTYDTSKLIQWNWDGTNIRKESQGVEKNKSTVQYKVIHHLINKGTYDIVFNDDGPKETADVVAIKLDKENRTIFVELYHCKFSSEDFPGARIADIDVVCGQAQKSIKYIKRPFDLFSRLLQRKPYSKNEKSVERLELGKQESLEQMYEMSKAEFETKFKIFVVQPGVSPKLISEDQKSLFGVTEDFLHSTYQIPFGVIVNDK